MIPQVAQRPRQLSQQFGNQGFATPLYDTIPPPRRLDRLAPLPFRGSRSVASSLAPPYRAYPVENDEARRSSVAHGASAAHEFGGQYNDPSEHMLRRKTPNGTLAAGYDGTPVQWSNKAPPLKHVVLPVSGDSSHQNGAYSVAALGTRRSGSLGGAVQQASRMTRFNGSEQDLRTGSATTPWPQSQFPAEPVQNVWDDIRTQPGSSFYPQNGLQIPTVLQPAYQTAPGPTADDGGGLYGPYWPDGRFVPYRPAAIRDNGRQSHQGPSSDQGAGRRFLPPTELLPPPRHLSFGDDLNTVTRLANFSMQNGGMAIQEESYKSPTALHTANGTTALYTMPHSCRIPSAEAPGRSNNLQFKERTLSWAHSIYVDLLAFLHQIRKEGRKSRQSHGSRTYSKNSIYPKPPRQAGSQLGSAHWPDLDANQCQMTRRRSHAGSTPASSRGSFTASFDGWQGPGGSNEPRYARSSVQDIPHYISPFQASPRVPISPMSKAKEALDMLATLCEESGWRWIDGMLLGGCLAYGLEEYQKALDWYSKIIALDPK